MSCSLDIFGCIQDLHAAKEFLNNKTPDESTWDDTDWGWEDDISTTEKELSMSASKGGKSGKEFLQSCVVSYSPVGDLLVIGKQSKAVIFLGNWDDKRGQMKFVKFFQGVLCENGDIITALACVPLISKKTSSPGTPDWTCILVGFSSGFVRMYTEEGLLLFQQQFHNNEGVKSFKIRPFEAATNSLEHDQLEEVIVVYGQVIVTLDGFDVFQTLRACRNHLARVKASAAGSTQPFNESLLLACKRWAIEGVDIIADCDLTELKTPPAFDHLYNGSLLGGISSKCSPSPNASSEFITVGKHPYLSFQYAQEKHRAPVLSDIAVAMANSIVNVAADWWRSKNVRGHKESTSSADEKASVPANMLCRFGFRDCERSGSRLAISPCHQFCAVTDNLGRIVLYDLARGLAVRIWKGYREAECSWLVAQEETTSKSAPSQGRAATFLIIYARMRNVIEVFPMQQGTKLATFHVNTGGLLLSASHGLLGVNDRPSQTTRPQQMLQTVFLDEDGRLYVFIIPFHLALEKANSKLKDIHLLKSLQQQIRGEFSPASILNVLTKISSEATINQAFRFLTEKCDSEQLKSVLGEYTSANGDAGKLNYVPFQLTALIELYDVLYKSYNVLDSSSDSVSEKPSFDHFDDSMISVNMTENEAKCLVNMWEKKKTQTHYKRIVRFEQANEILSSKEMFTCCNIEFDSSKLAHKDIRLNFSSHHIERLGQLLLVPCFSDTLCVFKWGEFVKNSNLNLCDLLKLTLRFWVENACSFPEYQKAMNTLFDVVKLYTELEGNQKIGVKFNEISMWWEEIRMEVSKCSQLFEMYSFSIVCRAVAIEIAREVENEANANESSDYIKNQTKIQTKMTEQIYEWESMPSDLLKWNILLKQVEDLSILSDVIMSSEKLKSPSLPILNQEIDPICATNLLEKGRGCIAETAGKWLTTIGIDPVFIAGLDEHPGSDEIAGEEIETKHAADGVDGVVRLVKILLDNFQVSVSSPSVILANYCWEYCLAWNMQTDHIKFLSAAFSCIKSISCEFIKKGMMSLIWHTVLLKKVCKEVDMEGVTGSHKWPEAHSEFGSSETRREFFSICADFFDVFMSTEVNIEKTSPSSQTSEFKNHWTSTSSSVSLVDLALSQASPNYEMLRLHYQLVLCALFIHVFQIRKPSIMPINMFDTQSRVALFQNLSQEIPPLVVDVDLALKNMREEFLCLVISGAIDNIPEEPGTDIATSVAPQIDGMKNCDKWISKCFELARMWGLDLDVLRINQVCEFYSSGFDFLGQQAIPTVRAKDVLGAKLLVIVGMRVSYLVNQNSECVPEMVSSVSTNLSNWLNNLDYSALKRLHSSKESITDLAQQVVQLIPESSYDFKLAEELLSSSSFI